jgi:dTDP-glucose 4,6-dehydratase
VDNFVSGEVYNIGGREEWVVGIEELADVILGATGASSSLAQYQGEEAFTTRIKTVDFSKARRDLKHDPKVDIREGIRRYVAWARRIYAT